MFGRICRVGGVVAGGLLLSAQLGYAATIFTATMSSDQEVPADTGSSASGFATLVLNDSQTRLEINLNLVGLDLDGLQTADPADDVAGFHIHSGPSGVNGPVVFGFINPNNDLNGDLSIDAAAGTLFSAWDSNEGFALPLADSLPALFSGGLYLNVHTPSFPGGEIRGQINIVPEPTALLLLGSGLVGLASRVRRARR